MIFPENNSAEETVDISDPAVRESPRFNYSAAAFELVDGKNRMCSGIDAVKQWLELFVRTPPGRYAVYGEQPFGVDAALLIGRKSVPSGAVLSELRRQIEEGVTLCPAIRAVYGFSLDRNVISFTVETHNGDEGSVEIEL